MSFKAILSTDLKQKLVQKLVDEFNNNNEASFNPQGTLKCSGRSERC